MISKMLLALGLTSGEIFGPERYLRVDSGAGSLTRAGSNKTLYLKVQVLMILERKVKNDW